jgi:hypothetical protein
VPSDSASSDNGAGSRSRQITTQRVVVVGYILAVAVPPLGFAIGIVLMLRPRLPSRHGALIVLVSIIAAVTWLLLVNAGALKDTSQGY